LYKNVQSKNFSSLPNYKTTNKELLQVSVFETFWYFQPPMLSTSCDNSLATEGLEGQEGAKNFNYLKPQQIRPVV